jgi:hypothetical protein
MRCSRVCGRAVGWLYIRLPGPLHNELTTQQACELQGDGMKFALDGMVLIMPL